MEKSNNTMPTKVNINRYQFPPDVVAEIKKMLLSAGFTNEKNSNLIYIIDNDRVADFKKAINILKEVKDN